VTRAPPREGRAGTLDECPLLAGLKVPTFDGHLNESNTDFEEVFDGVHAAQEIDSGIQA